MPHPARSLRLPDPRAGRRRRRRRAAPRCFLDVAAAGLIGAALVTSGDASAQVVISQVYGGNGNAYRQDFVELFNRGDAPVDLAGWSLQYASASGTGLFSGSAPSVLSGTLEPGRFLLVGLATSAAGPPLPTPLLNGNPATNLASASGKVALVRASVGLACNGGASPCGPAQLEQIVDLVGYGAASFFEGSAAAPAASAALGLQRRDGGCLDTFSNAADFVAAPPLPRTAATPASPCPPGIAVELSASALFASELDRSAIQLTATAARPVSGPQSVALVVTGSGVTPGDQQLDASVLAFPDGATSATTTLRILDDVLVEGSERASIVLASPSAGLRLGGAIHRRVTLADDDGCGLPATAIHAVQGAGLATPVPGSVVTVEGVVTGDFLRSTTAGASPGEGTAGEALGGFFVQEEDVDADLDPSTSEGLFVFENGSGLASGIAVGDRVRVRGTAAERAGGTVLEALADVGLCTHGEALPSAATVALPLGLALPDDDESAARAVIDGFAERHEGMRVRFPGRLSLADAFDLGGSGRLVLHANGADGGRIETWTESHLPSASALVAHRIDVLRRRVILDDRDDRRDSARVDGRPLFHPPPGLSLAHRLRLGDEIVDPTGILDRSTTGLGADDLWRLRPVLETNAYVFSSSAPRPLAPPDVGGAFRIASFNLGNYFTTIDTTASNASGVCGPVGGLDCRGADSASELARQTAKLVATLCGLDADVVALMEMENAASTPPATLANATQSIAGCGPYAPLVTGPIGGDAIRVALLLRSTSVTPIGPFRILDGTVDPRFLDGRNRPVLAQTLVATATGEKLTLAVVHLKSKGSPCDDIGDGDQGDGQGSCNRTRTRGAEALVDWLATDPTGSADPDFLIVGDLNSYGREDPVRAIQAGADDVPGTGDDYEDLVHRFAGPGAYSFVFDGQTGRLDHALASASLAAKATGAAEWHINADEPPAFDYDDAIVDPGESSAEAKPDALPLYAPDVFRSSDHDPLVVGLPEPGQGALLAAGLGALVLAAPRARRRRDRRASARRPHASEVLSDGGAGGRRTGRAAMTDEERKQAAEVLFASWTSKAMDELRGKVSAEFASELGPLAFDNVFAKLWVRPGLDLRARSFVTLGLLIALRAQEELKMHFPIALANGCTLQELEEVIYHATSYAGFPAANAARVAATESFRKQGLIDRTGA